MGTRLRDRNDSQLSRSNFTSILDRNARNLWNERYIKILFDGTIMIHGKGTTIRPLVQTVVAN